MTCGIYKLMSPSGKIYIGQSKDIIARFTEHKSDAKRCFVSGMGENITKLRASFQKYNWQQFSKEIIKICPQDRLNAEEIFYIALHNSFNDGLNSTTGGEGGFQRSLETKRKLRDKQLGKYGGVRAMAFYIDEIRYVSILDAASKLGIPHKTIHNRLNSKNKKYINYVYEDTSRIPQRKTIDHKQRSIKIMIDDIIYDSASVASIILNISTTTILRRARSILKNLKIIN